MINMLNMSITEGWEYVEEKIRGTTFTINYHSGKKVILVQKILFMDLGLVQHLRAIDGEDAERIESFIKHGKAQACYFYILAISGA